MSNEEISRLENATGIRGGRKIIAYAIVYYSDLNCLDISWGSNSCEAMEAPRLAPASPEGVFVALTAAEVSGFPAVVSSDSPNCTPPGKTNSSTWNASQ